MLDQYRDSFAEAYEATVGIVTKLGLASTGRPSKSTQSIREKLQRESIRLSQIQDIAGCRIVVQTTDHQEIVLALLQEVAANQGFLTTILDRRTKPSYGYRAIHVIVHVADRLVEVQIRTELQHIWAQLSEKLSDVYDPTIKYGGGGPRVRAELDRITNHIEDVELEEEEVRLIKQRVLDGDTSATQELFELSRNLDERWSETRNALYQMMADILRTMGEIID